MSDEPKGFRFPVTSLRRHGFRPRNVNLRLSLKKVGGEEGDVLRREGNTDRGDKSVLSQQRFLFKNLHYLYTNRPTRGRPSPSRNLGPLPKDEIFVLVVKGGWRASMGP